MNDDRIGTDVAGFRIESVLGQGGMGTVYLAVQSSPTRKVVLKLLRSELSRDEAFRRRFVHESEAAASTEHPNIVPIYAAGEADGVLYIAMRYVEGEDLRQLLARAGPLPPERTIEIASQVASALDAAHARGLVHRDVKPSNVLLDRQGNAYLSDFGLIKRSEVDTGLTKTGQFMGSIEYCAPEQIRGDDVDGRADVYALGCVLFEAIAGRPPFKRETEIATLYAHLEQEPPALSSLAPGSDTDLDPVVARALAKDPSERYPTAGAFARDARQATGVSSGERDAVPAAPSRGRTAWIAAGIAAAVIALVAVAVVALTGGSDAEEPNPAANPRVMAAAIMLDPETGSVVSSIGGFTYRSFPTFVGDLAAGEGAVWVAVPPLINHLDPVTGTVRGSVNLGFNSGNMAVGFRTVWVSVVSDIARINPSTDARLRTVRLEDPQDTIAGAGEIAVGDKSMWATTDQALYQIDPFTGRVIGSTEITGSTGMTAGDGTIWIVDDFSGTLTAFDESNGDVRDSVAIPGSLDAVASGGGSVWVLDKEAGVVSVVDPEGLTVVDTVRVRGDERDIVFGADAVWLADGSDRTVTRIEPATRQPTSFDIPGEAQYVTVDQETGDVWALSVPQA